MKKITIATLIGFLASFDLLACSFSAEIKENKDGSFNYSRECHIRVGQILGESRLMGDKIKELEKQLSLKDAIIENNEQRIVMWANTTNELHRAIMRANTWSSVERGLWFVSGFGLALLSVLVASQAIK